MYKILIFIVAFILTLFELSLWAFFDKTLDSNILILLCIAILPGIFTLLERDASEYQTIQHGRISKKILARKLVFYILRKLAFYATIFACIATLYLGLFFVIGNESMFSLTAYTIVILIIISSVSALAESIFEDS